MWEAINNFLVAVDDKVWGVPLMVLIIAGGVLLTSRLGFLQVRRLPLALKWMFKNEEEGDGEISSFAALCTALSATIGTGNIVGVATAVCAGGPGALFWMIVAAFFGMATKYSEGLLAVKYRAVAEDGHSLGGPFYYIEKGMGSKWKWLAKIFAILRCLCWSLWYRYFQPGKWYFQCGTELLWIQIKQTASISRFGTVFCGRCCFFSDSRILCGSNPDRRSEANCNSQPDHCTIYGSNLYCAQCCSDHLQHYRDPGSNRNCCKSSV